MHSRNSLEPKLTIPFEKFKEDVHKSLECITEEWVGERTPANSFKSPFFYGESTYDACLEAVADIWTAPEVRQTGQQSATLPETS